VSVTLSACSGAGGGSSPVDLDGGAGGDDGAAEVRSCLTRFSFGGPAELAGEWDWQAPTALADDDGDGVYTADLELDPGLHAFKLVVGGEWRLDPGNAYRTYAGGVENSAVRVDDCRDPLLALDSHQVSGAAAATRIRFVRGAGGEPAAAVAVALRHEGVETAIDAAFDGAAIAVELGGLAEGKYTLVVDASDAGGRAARRLLLPFWVEAEAFDWRDAVIYMAMVDRFQNGDPASDPGPTPGAEPSADFHGGDLAGVTAAIEDGTFERLGVRALWLSPLAANSERVHAEDGHGVTAYHGYWPVRARAVDPRIGGEEELDRLVAAAHRRGIRVLLDYVINHVHEDHEYVAAHPEWFRTGCECGTPGCGWTEHRLDCLFHAYLPDVNWQVREAGEAMVADALWWLERFDLDGLRVDAVKHVEDAAVFNLAVRVRETFEQAGTGYFLLGETAMGWRGHDLEDNRDEYATISRYVGEDALDGQFDFVLYHATAYRVWADDQYGMPHLDFWTRASLDAYPADAVMTPFVGSHDSERLVSLATYGSGAGVVHHKWPEQGLPGAPAGAEPYQRAALALTWMLSVPGAPLLYYGDEYGEHGGADPDNRHMWRPPGERSDAQRALHDRVARAGRARRELVALRRGAYTPLVVSEDVLAFARHTDQQAVVVAINRGGQTVSQEIAAPDEIRLPGTLADRLDPDRPHVLVSGNSFSITLAPRSAAVLAAP
jgi:glycosidase